jgi:hypothetical protein
MMTKSLNPDWVLNEKWAIGRDTHNFLLYKKSGQSWRPDSYYPKLEQLFQSFLHKLTRTEPAEVDLKVHIERCLDVAQAAVTLLREHIAAKPLAVDERLVPAACSGFQRVSDITLVREESRYAS